MNKNLETARCWYNPPPTTSTEMLWQSGKIAFTYGAEGLRCKTACTWDNFQKLSVLTVGNGYPTLLRAGEGEGKQ